ncbi:hypothetical protein EYB25_009603 [Talaromyces marneffei]|uniref:uncharacterized protein n=1 Tax=Talaromyces marneffei TaxID=37727 RepID=UPI0012A7A1EF|nr:uncharacterized protein EYB26_008871 [Talaromyces marneffei]KAE8547810.1 hypothetical protein EYB25_009603 [Talaromyces marneffei]QGA21161.1 hypothetical protein EYB26_008871 [Talaromyces marneffei]
MIAAPGAFSATILNIAGFTGVGVQSEELLSLPSWLKPGSLAATAQSALGNVAAGSTFAALQSAGAGGAAALGTINGVVQGVGAAILGSAAYLKRPFFKPRN